LKESLSDTSEGLFVLGNPCKTKRIKGNFSDNLAYVEQLPGGYDWHVVGKTTQIEGNFDMFCSLR
jgi:hypothetical protein